MPEGDSLHRVARRLQPLVGEQVAATSPNPRGLVTGVAAAVDGRVLESVEALGKHLELRFADGVVVTSHLRMSGRWTVHPPGEAPSGAPWLILRTARAVAFQWRGPVLRLGRVERHRVGSDILGGGVVVEALIGRLRLAEPGRPLGEVLQNQRYIAGIGNLWASEALWQARISPVLPIDAASDKELGVALTWARTQMQRAVVGSRPAQVVYRRVGRPCPRCGAAIVARGVGEANRTAYWCPGCQREA
jgi:endonuclease VIII